MEQESDTKYEFVNGQVYAMAGASQRHNDLAAEVLALLRTQLRGKPAWRVAVIKR
jgi:Uma2 family endonuclease